MGVNFDALLGKLVGHKHQEHVLKSGDKMTGPLRFDDQIIIDGTPASFASSWPFVRNSVQPTAFMYLDSTYKQLRIGTQKPSVYNTITFELPHNNEYQDLMSMTTTSFAPASAFDNIIDFGASGNRWKSLHVGTGSSAFNGPVDVTNQDNLLVGSVIVPQTKSIIVFATFGTTSRTVFIADEAYQVVAIRAVWSGTASTGTFNLEKLTGSTANGSGNTMQSAGQSATSAQTQSLSIALTSTTADLQLAAGDRIGWNGDLNNNLPITMTITLKRI